MKNFLLLSFILLSLNVYAGKNTALTTPVMSSVVAESSISFMGKTFYFSHWEIPLYNPQWNGYTAQFLSSAPTLNLPIGFKYLLNYKNVPTVFAIYYPKGKHLTHHSLNDANNLGPLDEYITLSTEGRKDPYAYVSQFKHQNPIIQCADGVITYSTYIFDDENPTILVNKTTQEGHISFYGVLTQKQETSIEKTRDTTGVNTFTQQKPTFSPMGTDSFEKGAQTPATTLREGTFFSYSGPGQEQTTFSKASPITPDFRTFHQQPKSISTGKKVLKQEANSYVAAMSQFEIPQWIKEVPTLQQLKKQK